MKGVELPINILVIVAIAVIVLLALVALYFIGFSPFSTSISIEGVKNAACSELVRRGCIDTTNTIQTPGFDSDNDGTSGETAANGDNLDKLCENFYNRINETDCKRLCGCP
jgi:hypothetical protein